MFSDSRCYRLRFDFLGATADEILTVLVKKFPDRDPDGMRKTVLIQASKNCTSKERVEKRGLIYFNRRRSAHVGA
jgi:hypothetical protein